MASTFSFFFFFSFFSLALNCLSGINFYKHYLHLALVARVQERIEQSPCSRVRTPNHVMNLVVLSLPVVLAACQCQSTHLPVLVHWFADPLGVRVPTESFEEWPKEDNLKDFI